MALHVPEEGWDAADRAEQLAPVAERHRQDPFADIDWSVPIDDRALHLPERFLPLCGTPAWRAMTDEERRAYSRHECAAFLASVIWFENILMTMVVRHLYGMPVDDSSHRFLLVEVEDECRHSVMFAEYIRRAGTPPYRPSPRLRLQGDLFRLTQGRVASFIAILAAEVLVDAVNRATAESDDIHPVSRRIAQIHMGEEGRHVSYARTFLAEEWPRLNPFRRAAIAAEAPLVTFAVADALVNPDVYRTLGVRGGHRQALTNPRHHERIAADLAKFTDFMAEIGVIGSRTRLIWRALGLVPV